MWKYILKRLLYLIPVLFGVTLLVYIIMSVAPGDPAKAILGDQATPEAIAQLREELGLDDPIIVQYLRYAKGLLKGDLGTSYKSKGPVITEIAARIPTTLKLTFSAIIIAVIVAIPLGVVAAIKQNTLFDGLSMFIALLGISMPIFWLGILLLIQFAQKLGWFPSSGAESWKSFVLPGIALGFHSMASIARTTRSSMLEVIRQDYIRTARSKGMPYNQVVTQHALPNALIPTITVVGLQIGALMAGSVLTESVFSLPGIGRLIIFSIQGRDIPVVLGCILVFTIVFSIVNLLVDLLYAYVDPRIKAQYS
ncbi:MAG: ABC transporter permease [Tissierellia bacterium]|nr:ABC transporter permease [Tissierellia bacterium]